MDEYISINSNNLCGRVCFWKEAKSFLEEAIEQGWKPTITLKDDILTINFNEDTPDRVQTNLSKETPNRRQT